jgi:hypothetical protein
MNNSENKPDAPVQPLLDDGRKPAPQIPKLNIFEIIMSGQRPSANKYSAEMALHRPVPLKDNDETTNRYALDRLTRQSLPYPTPWRMADSDPNAIPPDFSWLANSCGGKAAIGVFGGGVMGLLMGVFLGAMSDATPPLQVIAGKDVPQAPLREQVKLTFRATADKSLYWCRNFAFITGVFGGSECLVEKFRGKHGALHIVLYFL